MGRVCAPAAAAAITFLVTLSCCFAHGDPRPVASPWWMQWTLPPAVLLCLSAISCAYLVGWKRTKSRSQAKMGLGRLRPLLFATSILFLFLALTSPIDALSDRLQSMHMVQHTLLMMVAAPLFVLGAPAYILILALPRSGRRAITSRVNGFTRILGPAWQKIRPLAAVALYALTLWLWHLPAMYEAAMRNEVVHDIAHLSFFVSSCFLWWVVLHPFRHMRLDYGAGIAYLFVTSLHSCALGVLTALSPRIWYPSYTHSTMEFGLTPIQDQQIAGYIMWMPAGTSYILAAAYLFVLWIKRSAEEGAKRRSRRMIPTR
ncbi:MAG: cytochrome c oxidase assembly protein [Deltaproteobacteria bacterium]|nr:cytochrome c oxidase assembly protein [Deltaproteobacteria bacterium]